MRQSTCIWLKLPCCRNFTAENIDTNYHKANWRLKGYSTCSSPCYLLYHFCRKLATEVVLMHPRELLLFLLAVLRIPVPQALIICWWKKIGSWRTFWVYFSGPESFLMSKVTWFTRKKMRRLINRMSQKLTWYSCHFGNMPDFMQWISLNYKNALVYSQFQQLW